MLLPSEWMPTRKGEASARWHRARHRRKWDWACVRAAAEIPFYCVAELSASQGGTYTFLLFWCYATLPCCFLRRTRCPGGIVSLSWFSAVPLAATIPRLFLSKFGGLKEKEKDKMTTKRHIYICLFFHVCFKFGLNFPSRTHILWAFTSFWNFNNLYIWKKKIDGNLYIWILCSGIMVSCYFPRTSHHTSFCFLTIGMLLLRKAPLAVQARGEMSFSWASPVPLATTISQLFLSKFVVKKKKKKTQRQIWV